MSGRVKTDAEREECEQLRRDTFVRDYSGRVITSCGYAYILRPVLCAVDGCTSFASFLDRFAPYHMEQNRCVRHAGTSPDTKGGKTP